MTDTKNDKRTKNYRDKMMGKNERFRDLMFAAIKDQRERPPVGVNTASIFDRAVPVRARMATYRFTASAINDL